ncbi:hypothetical protein L198_06276 [Cryptococcus wingfieldii CBS 7118]|uniref:Uncharacterized protein n=1 Tax=Cryptococcus wingfieldii CBS 7118 TaxID=1295528 RepID=A0A1E3INY8_9TREE|nr:hypothetical protein L198_06276 [Cryptococcus wingfieldii CBS 7118]ODN90258.1 hypothetical protein L198_06276 [Cryptococcus wingfieldii CBS 7118]
MSSFGTNPDTTSTPSDPTPSSAPATQSNDVTPSPLSSSPLPTSTTATATTTGPKHRHNEHTLPDGTRVIEDERTWGGEDGGGVSKVVIKRWERPAGSHAAGERGGGVGAGEGGVGSGGMEREHLLRDVRLNHINDALFSRFLQPPSDASEATDTRSKWPSEDFFSDAFFPLPMPSFGRLVFPEEEDPSLLPPHLSAPQAANNPKPHHTSSTTPSNPQIHSWSYASSGSLSGWGLVAGMVAVGAGVWGWRGRKRVKVLEQRVGDLTRGSQMSARANVVRPAQAAQATPGSAGSLAPNTSPTAAMGEIEALQKRVEELENALRSMGSLAGYGEKRQGGRVLDELRKGKDDKTE